MTTLAPLNPTDQLLAVYLNDHLAGATVGVELSHRIARQHAGDPLGDDMAHLAAQIRQDREVLLQIMRDLRMPVRRYKVCQAWLGEKAARMKLNGRVVRRSPLSTLIELETLQLGVQGKLLLWRTLVRAAERRPALDPAHLHELAERASEQTATVGTLRSTVAGDLFAPGTPSGIAH